MSTSHSSYRINERFRAVESIVEEYASELSATHVRLRTRTPLAVGARVQLAFIVDHDGFRLFEAEGAVVTSSDAGSANPTNLTPLSTMDVQFTELGDSARQILDVLRRSH